jgi:hypothetical protein
MNITILSLVGPFWVLKIFLSFRRVSNLIKHFHLSTVFQSKVSGESEFTFTQPGELLEDLIDSSLSIPALVNFDVLYSAVLLSEIVFIGDIPEVLELKLNILDKILYSFVEQKGKNVEISVTIKTKINAFVSENTIFINNGINKLHYETEALLLYAEIDEILKSAFASYELDIITIGEARLQQIELQSKSFYLVF